MTKKWQIQKSDQGIKQRLEKQYWEFSSWKALIQISFWVCSRFYLTSRIWAKDDAKGHIWGLERALLQSLPKIRRSWPLCPPLPPPPCSYISEKPHICEIIINYELSLDITTHCNHFCILHSSLQCPPPASLARLSPLKLEFHTLLRASSLCCRKLCNNENKATIPTTYKYDNTKFSKTQWGAFLQTFRKFLWTVILVKSC